MSINEINEQAKESLKKYFKDGQDIQHDDDTKKQLTIEEMYQSVDDEIKEIATYYGREFDEVKTIFEAQMGQIKSDLATRKAVQLIKDNVK